MRIDPSIAALRGNRAPQRQAQAAMKVACDDWRAEKGVAQALAEFENFGTGAALEDCPLLEDIFTGQGAAEQLMSALVSHFCAALSGNWLGHPPFRNGYDGRASTILLGKTGRAQMLLQAREPGTFEYPCATFSDALRYDATLAGSASARILRIHGPRELVSFSEEPITLRAGVRLAFDCSSEMLIAETVETRLVTLRLLQVGAPPQPGREYCRETGRLLHQSSGSLATSRKEMMVTLLGRMECTKAPPVLSRLARDEHDESLRWQAVRECLALDTAQGFTLLCQIARDMEDGLSDPAGALRAQLLETHPQLRELETQ
ncbi:hypothetical protein GCM10009127_14590 [Alteraurantiacibacter aestuarii]|uniref:Uncharacterized protein n=1 Tax=Alteraurantiacibacter aestuarii TaxID=650004 RepID=A0A844ZKB8_9SPHN|nr:hypothetical protein [Alteraurantiacibacter aestuarii]MXO87953.1 hypothetical protein [Alteraurantiacibacter aestuarii]